MKRISLIILFFLAAPTAHCQDIDKNELKTLVKTLTADSMQGRFPGTQGIKRAANFIERSFRDAGLTDVKREEFDLFERGYGEVYLRSGKKKFYCPEDVIVQGRARVDEETEKQLVFAGRGSVDELKSVDVANRVVLVFVSNLRVTFDIARELHKRNAYALIVANPDNPLQFDPIQRSLKDHVMARRLGLEDRDTARNIPALDTMKAVGTFIIKNELIPVLMNSSTKDLLRSIEKKSIKDIPVSNIYLKAEVKTRVVRSSNIVAHLPGLIDSTIIISAHYDHMGSNGSEIFRGADDNASGTAAIILLAKKYAKAGSSKYSITFLAATAEEEGRLGSIYHANTKGFDPKKIVFNVNIDMVGSNDVQHRPKDQYIYVVGHSNPVPMKDLLEKAAAANNIRIDYSQSGTVGFFQRSDQYSFYERGIPAIHLFSGVHDRYHKATDTYDSLNYPLLVRRIAFANTFIQLLGNR